jgi:hypothetical protein
VTVAIARREALPAVAEAPVGAPGTGERRHRAFEGLEATPVPTTLAALTVKE